MRTTLPDRAQLAEDAVIWGFPLVLTGRYLKLAAERGFGFNRFRLNARLADASLKVVAPNIETLYGMAWIDVTAEPQVLSVPDTHDRYYAIMLIDAYMTTFKYISRRETGTKAGVYVITGPGWCGALPPNVVQVKSPTDLVVAFARTLVKGESDFGHAQAIQAQYSLGPLSEYPARRTAPIVQDNAIDVLPPIDLSTAGSSFFDELCALLTTYPPVRTDVTKLERFAPIGVRPGRTPSQDPDLAPILAAAVLTGMERIRKTNLFLHDTGTGWWVNDLVTGYTIEDPLLRASINEFGPGFQLATELLYFFATTGSDERPLEGAKRYKLDFRQDPPVDAFWSLSLYGAGRTATVIDNPFHRFAIYTYTPGLKRGRDGSLEIFVQHEQPAEGPSNWLPAPKGPFRLFFRAYQPQLPFLDGSYKLPSVQLI
jgi:hypothetical protein